MSINIGSRFKVMREAHGFTQSNIADKIGLSLPSYIDFEKGRRSLALDQATQLADLFGVSLDEMVTGELEDSPKYKQIILAFMQEYQSENIFKTKLAKLVYLADFAYYYHNLKSMSGMRYKRLAYGPVADAYFRTFDELREDGLITVEVSPPGTHAEPAKITRAGLTAPLNLLSKDELELIKKISEKWKNASKQEIVTFTHNQLPWAVCRDNEIIPYELITQEEPENIF